MKRFGTSPLPILTVLFALTIALAAAGEKRMTIEDSLAIKQTGAPQISPDGKWVAYTITEWDKSENRRSSHIWLAPVEGGRSIKLTNGDKGDSSPQWSPDSTRIAFLSERNNGRDKGTQIWIIPTFGGEAEKLTSEENNVQAFRWSPDGRKIAFITRDAQKDKAEREKRKKDKFDTIVVDADLSYSHLWTIGIESKEKKRLTDGGYSVTNPQWSPDGKSIAFVQSRSGIQESPFIDISDDRNTDIYIVGSDGGTPVRLTSNPAGDSNPQWSPDGLSIAYIANSEPASWAGKNDLMIIPAAGGAPRNLTKDFLESIGPSIEWAPDGKLIYFMSGVGVYTHIYTVPMTGGKVSQLTRESRNYGAFSISDDLSGSSSKNAAATVQTSNWKIAYSVSDSLTPDDIWVAPLNKIEEARKITWVNPEIKDFALGETSIISWKGADNLDIEGLLVKPVGYEPGKRYPLILMIHGGPYSRFTNSFNSRAHIWAANGYAVLMPNPRGSTGYGHKFTVANVGDWGGKDFKDIMAGVDDVIARGIADPDKLVVMGGSYGGFMTFWTITQTNRFKAAIGHAGISDWYSFYGQSDIPGLMEYGFDGLPWESGETFRKYSPMTFVDRVKTPIMITHGENDQRVPITQAEQYYRALKKRGIPVLFLRYPREGHGIQEPNHIIDLTARQLEWFDSHLGIKRTKPAETNTVTQQQTNN